MKASRVKDDTSIPPTGDQEAALRLLFEGVYAELKKLARAQLAASAGNTLNTTALVHEVYLKLQPSRRAPEDRAHFFALAAKAMRQIVIDHARARLTQKRGGSGAPSVTLEAAADIADTNFGPDDLLRLDRALHQIEQVEPSLAQLVEQRFFTGLSIADIAAMQSISERTLNRDWRRAKAQLHAALHPDV
jgi:RNA polymerase sigma factor (TIGR02999 family)